LKILLHNTTVPCRLPHCLQEVTFQRDIQYMVGRGYLVRPEGFSILTEEDLSQVQSTTSGDFREKEVGGQALTVGRRVCAPVKLCRAGRNRSICMPNAGQVQSYQWGRVLCFHRLLQLEVCVNTPHRNALTARAYQALAPGRQGIVFCVGVRVGMRECSVHAWQNLECLLSSSWCATSLLECMGQQPPLTSSVPCPTAMQHAFDMRDAFREAGVTCEAVHGKLMPAQRAEMLHRFQTGETQASASFYAHITGVGSAMSSTAPTPVRDSVTLCWCSQMPNRRCYIAMCAGADQLHDSD